ncbi:hypothetical protein [Candidatus Bathycorpusculum sp.]|uniref:hypothetical protein n=1 Tax=Candidatus Bathycorpusculum sp. TaxID=2994959 RepID=UPI00282F1E9F|nr:hypothetical protein [Candidatus Termitimicrobium sp.]
MCDKQYCARMDITTCMGNIPGSPEYYLNASTLKDIIIDPIYQEALRKKLTNQLDGVPPLAPLDLSKAISATKQWLEKDVFSDCREVDEANKRWLAETNFADNFNYAAKRAADRMDRDGISPIQTRQILLFWFAFFSVLRLVEGRPFKTEGNIFKVA